MTVVKPYLWRHFPHTRFEASHLTRHPSCPVSAGSEPVIPFRSIFVKMFFSNMTRLVAGCTLWKFLAEREVACDDVSIDVPNVGDKMSVTIKVNTVFHLRGELAVNVCLRT